MAKNRYNIAVIPGDGIGKEVVPEALKVLEKISGKHDINLHFDHFDFSSYDYFSKHGQMMRDDWKQQIGGNDRLFYHFDKDSALTEENLPPFRFFEPKHADPPQGISPNAFKICKGGNPGILTRTDTDIQEAVNAWFDDKAGSEVTYGPIEKWRVDFVTNMKDLFKDRTTFNADISEWDVNNVTDMSGMFENASSFNQPIVRWNTSKVQNMSNMFDGATKYNQAWGQNRRKPYNLFVWNTSNVTDMSNMFAVSYTHLTLPTNREV